MAQYGQITVGDGTGGQIGVVAGGHIDFTGGGYLNNPFVPTGSTLTVTGDEYIGPGGTFNTDPAATLIQFQSPVTTLGRGRYVDRFVPGIPSTGAFTYDVSMGRLMALPPMGPRPRTTS